MHDQGRPFVDAGVALRAPKVTEDGDFLEVRLRYPKSQFPGEQRIPPGGVHHHPRRYLGDGSGRVLRPDPDRLLPVEHHILHLDAVAELDTQFHGPLQQQAIEIAAPHLPGGGALVGIGLREVEGCGTAARGAEELDTVLALEVTLS